MQLKKRRSIRKALAAATCTLLSSPGHSASAKNEPLWDAAFSSLYYSETDRITVSENAASARKQIRDEEFVTVKIITDTMTGASPNGAAPASDVQSFTAPSGGTTVIAPGDTPLADFSDARVGVDTEWERPFNLSTTANYGASVSVEKDYTSLGASAVFRRDVNQRLTTITAGVAADFDSVDAVGGIPYELQDTASTERKSGDSKVTLNLLGGVTRIINRRTIAQLNYTITDSSGYLTDPYKIVSIMDAAVNPDGNHSNLGYIFESRPDNRLMQSLYFKILHQIKDDVVTLSYRYYWDDWDIASSTFDLRYRYEIPGDYYLQPHVRFYTQSAAGFYRLMLLDTEVIPEFVSADYRLGKLDSATAGLKLGGRLRDDLEFGIRAEYLRQEDRAGEFQSLDAVILQGSISYIF